MNWRFDRELLAQVWRLAWPTVVYALLQTLVGLVDVYMVGRLGPGPDAIAAVGFGRHVLMLVMVGVLALSTGTTTLVAQFTGAGRRRDAGRVVGQALLSMFVLGLALGVVGALLSRRLLVLMGAQGMVLEQGDGYLRLVLAGAAFMLVNFAVAASFRGAGDTLTPLKIALSVNGINVLGNYLFIFGIGPFPMLGVAGAAVGTILARATGAGIGVILLVSGRYRAHCRLDRQAGWFDLSLIKRMLNIGLPAAVQGFFRNGARLLFYTIVATSAAGAVATAALTVGSYVRMVTIMPSLAFQVAATALVGQRIGAGDWKQAEAFGWETVKLCTVIMAVVTAALFVFAPAMVGIFTEDRAVVALGGTMLRYFALGQLFSAVSITVGGGLIGAGDTRPPLYYTIVSQWLLMLPLAWVLVRKVGLDPEGAWMAFAIAPVLQAALTVQRFRSGKWKHIRV